MHYVYLLFSDKDSKFYTGSTNDLKRRLYEHNSGNVRSTTNRRPLKLIYYEVYPVKFRGIIWENEEDDTETERSCEKLDREYNI